DANRPREFGRVVDRDSKQIVGADALYRQVSGGFYLLDGSRSLSVTQDTETKEQCAKLHAQSIGRCGSELYADYRLPRERANSSRSAPDASETAPHSIPPRVQCARLKPCNDSRRGELSAPRVGHVNALIVCCRRR